MTGDPAVHPRIAERAKRTRRIRRGVGAGTLAAFALAWGVIAQTGSMGTATAATTTAGTTSTSTSTSADTPSATDDGSSSSSSSSDSGSDQPSAVTTAQS